MKFTCLLLITITAALFQACSISAPYVETPDYENPRYEVSHIKNDEIKIGEVIDARLGKTFIQYKKTIKDSSKSNGYINLRKRSKNYETITVSSLGIVEIDEDKRPYIFSDSLTEFVNKSLNIIFHGNNNIEGSKNVKVVINEFDVFSEAQFFKEEAHFKCSIDFIYDDGTDQKTYSTHYSDSFSSTFFTTYKRLQIMIYEGIYNCAESFINQIGIKQKKKSGNTEAALSENEMKKDSLIYQSTFKKAIFGELSISGYSGNNIVGGLGFSISSYPNTQNKNLILGYGASHSFYIENIWEEGRASYQDITFSLFPIFYLSAENQNVFITNQFVAGIGFEDVGFERNMYLVGGLTPAIGINLGSVVFRGGYYYRVTQNAKYLPNHSGFFIEMGYKAF